MIAPRAARAGAFEPPGGPHGETDGPKGVALLSRGPAQTQAIGRLVGQLARGDEIIALAGPLGSGKTCFVQGLARGLGIRRRVNSPSFVLLKNYRGRLALSHWDWYRLETTGDLDSSGFGDPATDRGVVAIEWADRFLDRVAEPFLLVNIEPTGARQRRLVFHVRGRSPALDALVGAVADRWTRRETDRQRRR